ncbi:thioredoxin family protein [Pedobacter nutrimenti]|jgi:hypothetical protein|uniref:Thioredoxin-like protein n=1 Tax=Pedobacter nutrimenti TaxID=1241337 RepID=A0A318UHV3_9SPHI|nr:thioredoxin family protein [Pedobacter nutrimenti]PYF76014.1 thioredoxin-like protein [Pedobacter nutrimenti]
MINYSNIFVKNGLNYEAYRKLIADLLAQGKTTGEDDSQAMLHYTKMNIQRMNRVDKTIVLQEKFTSILEKITGSYRLLVISEGWCGDAAQIVPLFHKMELVAPERFSLRFVLRDEHLDLIDAHLTGGGRAIPVLLILNEKGEVLAKWGPRPAILQALLKEWKAAHTDALLVAEKLHGWYAKDKTLTTQEELAVLFSSLD